MPATQPADSRVVFSSDRSLLQANAIVRWLAVGWATIAMLISQGHLVRPWLAYALIGLALAFSAAATVAVRTEPAWLLTPAVVVIELAIAAALLVGDGIVYDNLRPQSLPWAFPAAGLVATGIAFGRRWAALAAGLLAVASFVGEGLNDDGGGKWGITASSKAGLYLVTALVAGYVAKRLREAESEISAARAREEIAVRLHDGVLQTLAVVQRRSADPELAALARDQERDLRDFLAGNTSAQPGLTASLRDVAALFERRHDARAEVVIADDVIEPADQVIDAIAGAVGEALANAGKHSGGDRVVIYVEPDFDSGSDSGNDSGGNGDRAGLFVSVKDNGVGFDPDAVTKRIGIRDSITGRIEAVGGQVEIHGRPGRGAEVRIRI